MGAAHVGVAGKLLQRQVVGQMLFEVQRGGVDGVMNFGADGISRRRAGVQTAEQNQKIDDSVANDRLIALGAQGEFTDQMVDFFDGGGEVFRRDMEFGWRFFFRPVEELLEVCHIADRRELLLQLRLLQQNVEQPQPVASGVPVDFAWMDGETVAEAELHRALIAASVAPMVGAVPADDENKFVKIVVMRGDRLRVIGGQDDEFQVVCAGAMVPLIVFWQCPELLFGLNF